MKPDCHAVLGSSKMGIFLHALVSQSETNANEQNMLCYTITIHVTTYISFIDQEVVRSEDHKLCEGELR